MRKVMMDDVAQCYSSDKVKKGTDVACFIDPHFKISFSQHKDHDHISFIVEEAVKLEEITSLPLLE